MAIVKTATNKATGERIGFDDQTQQWGPLPSQGVETAVEQSIMHGTPIQPPSMASKIVGGALGALNWPHENISKPIAEKVDPYVPKVPFTPPNAVPEKLRGPVGTPLDVDPRKVVSLAEIMDFPVYGGVGKALKAGAGLVGKGIKALRGVKPPEAPPLTEATADINASADALLKEMGLGQPAAPAEAAAAPATPFMPPEPGMGPLFGGAREVAQRPPHLQVVKPTAPSAGAQGSLFPPAAISPPQYGPGRGPVGPPPPPPESFGGNVPRERLGTETARLKRAIGDIERLRAIMGGK